MTPPAYAQIVPLGAPIAQAMTYAVPADLHAHIRIGSRALIPLGARWTTGIVVGFQDRYDLEGVKSVGILLDPYPVLSEGMIDLCRWVADYYLCTLSEVLKTALPAGIHTHSGQRIVLQDADRMPDGLVSPRQQAVLGHLRSSGPATLRQIERRLGGKGVRSAVYGLLRRGLISVDQEIHTPRVRPKRERIVELVPQDARWIDVELPQMERRAPMQAECIRRLWRAGGHLPSTHLTSAGIGAGVLRALADRKVVRFGFREVLRDPYANLNVSPPQDLAPTTHQQKAIEEICQSLDAGTFQAHLLHGVTGSGKTLIYIRAAAHALKAGRGALILVPEISLTPQTVRSFRAHFGNRVAVLHSALSEGERYDAWREVREGKRTIVIGARSAVFAPVQNLGLIVVDEEHDGSYKQADPAPRYNARDVAVVRAKMEGSAAVLGSATPSLESYHNADIHKFNLLCLPERIDARPLPEVILVDMKKEGGGIFSRPLREKMVDRLRKKERIILLQNRRGYAPFVQCTDCGRSLECPNCQVTFTYHATGRRMVCHYCARNVPAPACCDACGRANLQLFGVGTQRVEEALKAQFPEARMLRMDVDTTRRKGAHDRILESFRRGDADLLLGTQMVAKGLDFSGVTLVGVISADTSIHLPDFRAGERTFQLLTQVSGRAGRGATPGEVVVQTYLPDGEAVGCAREHNFLKFAQLELAARQSVGYPPFGRMALFLFRGKDEHEVARKAGICAEAMRSAAPPGVNVMGPVQAPLARIRGNYRWQVILKTVSPHKLNALARRALDRFGNRSRNRRSGVILDIDIDPISIL